MTGLELEVIVKTTKVVTATLASGLAYLWAQVQWPGLDEVGSLGILGVLAVIVGRYTFRQLEEYRADLKNARGRIEDLEDDLHTQGQAKAKAEARIRELELYIHRRDRWLLSQGIEPPSDIPPPQLSGS